MRTVVGLALVLGVASCSTSNFDDSGDESVGRSAEALNGSFSPKGFLTIKGANIVSPDGDELARRQNTDEYYASPSADIAPEQPAGVSIHPGLETLQAFRNRYQFGGLLAPERIAYYYNRGDLGLGREMHCTTDQFGEFACYVTNFAAGDDFGEFTFGLSSQIAFANMHKGKKLATVAMVFRPNSHTDKMLFLAYNADDTLVNNAPLDRHGINFANGFAAAGDTNPDPVKFGVPGVNFNNHIPSNCLNCHGGTYNASTHSVTGGLFLPWDLDQLEFENVPGRTRAEQEDTLRELNNLARSVAVASGGSSMVQQIDGWYNNTSPLSGSFQSGYVPPGWSGKESFYFNVVRRSCRGCHLASALSFDTADSFLSLVPAVHPLDDVSTHKMPHALQAQREFWLSSQPAAMEAFFSANGEGGVANSIEAARLNTIVTLDPPEIMATLSF